MSRLSTCGVVGVRWDEEEGEGAFGSALINAELKGFVTPIP